MIEFVCDVCGERYELDDALAGKPIRCRSCRELCRVSDRSPATPPTPAKSKSILLSQVPPVVYVPLLAVLFMVVLLCWPYGTIWGFLGGVFGAVIYGTKGRSALIGFLYGGLAGPLFVWLFLLDQATGRKQCPFCAEKIKKEAIVCPHCQRDLQTTSNPRAKVD